MIDRVRILVVSSVTPKPTGFGEITLHRHLCERRDFDVTVVPPPPEPRIARLLRRTVFRSWLETRQVKRMGARWDTPSELAAKAVRPNLILTIAAGDAYHAARRLAAKTRLPLVTIFHDWWPDLLPRHLRAGEEQLFRSAYQASRVALCVGEGMRRELGKHPDSRVLIPIPGDGIHNGSSATRSRKAEPFQIRYSGNLREYGPTIQTALESLKSDTALRLEARGMNPRWPKFFREEMRALGMYHEFAPRAELEQWLTEADALLIVMAFDKAMRRMVETCFPSKLLEFARFGKPLIIWGPEYCSAIQWGGEGRRALCISSPEPSGLKLALRELSNNPKEQERLANEALDAARTEFDPDAIHQVFVEAIEDSVRMQQPSLVGL